MKVKDLIAALQEYDEDMEVSAEYWDIDGLVDCSKNPRIAEEDGELCIQVGLY
tara:strand:- start:1474 stop:1632 length:159 start_codon:yes stop_codon:yes gene_type:complete